MVNRKHKSARPKTICTAAITRISLISFRNITSSAPIWASARMKTMYAGTRKAGQVLRSARDCETAQQRIGKKKQGHLHDPAIAAQHAKEASRHVQSGDQEDEVLRRKAEPWQRRDRKKLDDDQRRQQTLRRTRGRRRRRPWLRLWQSQVPFRPSSAQSPCAACPARRPTDRDSSTWPAHRVRHPRAQPAAESVHCPARAGRPARWPPQAPG
jgi:hypothetical protein